MIMCQPDSGEMALEVVDQLVRSSAIDIIVVDSVAALVPRAEIEGEIGAVQGASLARVEYGDASEVAPANCSASADGVCGRQHTNIASLTRMQLRQAYR